MRTKQSATIFAVLSNVALLISAVAFLSLQFPSSSFSLPSAKDILPNLARASYSSKLTDVASSRSVDEVISKFSLDRRLWNHREEMLQGINDNLNYLRTPQAVEAYKSWTSYGLTREEVISTLNQFKLLLETSSSADELHQKVGDHFILRRAAGQDGTGTIKFTGYFQPMYQASRVRTPRYQYPIYRLPAQFESWKKPHPTRIELEGYGGRGNDRSSVKGLELAWLKSRWEAFMIHLQGSAILEFDDGSNAAVGFAAGTQYPFRGISASYLKQHKVAWNALPEFFNRYPAELDALLSRNNRFIFFKENPTPHPMGSLGVPVIAERSIATDKLRMPPGALSLLLTRLPVAGKEGEWKLTTSAMVVLDQDTGSAIKGPGRVDIFMGSGKEAQHKANQVFSKGELYFLVRNHDATNL